jgi:cellulose synthase/poly-beta-1,6-N-acetylglucosamine synthase-like glycosyltransferase
VTETISALTSLLIAVEIGLGLIVGYLLLLTGAALFAKRKTFPREGAPTTRFVIMTPAHNEAQLLPQLLKSLAQMDYPRELYAVHVVADNCSDSTAELGRASGAIVHERFNTTLRGKGYALQWLHQRILERGVEHDAIVILDADTIVSPNLLSVMDARMSRGERAIQAYYAVRAPESSRSAGIRAAALTVLHYLRPQGRMVLGGSVGLKGNGMAFAADILRRHGWSASLTEDIEYHMTLILAGERVTFAPDAVVWAEMPDSLKASQTQNERWERGRMDIIKSYVPNLIREGLRRRSFLLLDAAIEQLIPPFAVVAGLSVIVLLSSLLLANRFAAVLAAAIVAGQAIYLLAGLSLARAPLCVYKSLLFAPFYVAWKLLLYGRLLLGIKPRDWLRTARNQGPGS